MTTTTESWLRIHRALDMIREAIAELGDDEPDCPEPIARLLRIEAAAIDVLITLDRTTLRTDEREALDALRAAVGPITDEQARAALERIRGRR